MNINISVIVLLKKETENIVHLFSSLAEQSLKEIEVIILQTSKCEKYSYEIATLRDKVASLTINQFDSKYTDSDLIIEGCKLAKGKYVIVIDENCIFESRTLEELVETAEQNSADIVQFKVHTVPASGVTEYQAGIYAEEFAIRSGEMNQLDLLNECYLKNEISKRIIGKLVGTDVIFKATELAEKYGGSYEELIFFFCVVSCNKYVSLINKTYMNYSLMPEVILAVTSKEFNDKLNRKKICEAIDQFASEHILDQNGSNIFVQIADHAYIAELKKIITLWLSPRVQENQRQNYLCFFHIPRNKLIW